MTSNYRVERGSNKTPNNQRLKMSNNVSHRCQNIFQFKNCPIDTGGAAYLVELFTPSIAIVTQLKKLHHFSHLALETSLQCNYSSKYSAGYCHNPYCHNEASTLFPFLFIASKSLLTNLCKKSSVQCNKVIDLLFYISGES